MQVKQNQLNDTRNTYRVKTRVMAITAALYVFTTLTTPLAMAESPRYVGVTGNASAVDVAHQLDSQSPKTDPATQPPIGVYDGVSNNGKVDYRANVNVGKVAVEVDKDDLPADGQSASEITVKLYDNQGQALTSPAFITVEISGGRLLLNGAKTDEFGPNNKDLDKVTPGTQIKVEGGTATFKLLAPAEPQDVNVRITAGKVTAAGTISFLPELREMVAAGLIEGIISKRHISANAISPARQNDGFEQEIRRWSHQFNSGKANWAARTAFFVKGKIRGDMLLTAAYDSDKETRARLVRDVRPDEFYPVYGDSAIHGFDAKSASRLYVRVDKDKSYALFGDFNTGMGFSQQLGGGNVATLQLRNLGQYNRTATGVRGHYEKGNLLGNAFVTRDSLKQVIEEYPGNGTSGPFAVRNNSALENSEKVEIIIRDKNQVNVIKEVRTLSRFDDYVFEPFSGRILLKTPLMALTPNGDGQSLRITYEVDQGGQEFWVGGVDGQFKLTDNVEVGGAWIEDRNPLSPYRLQSANAGIKLNENTMLVGEVAHSQSTQYQNGINLFATPTGQAGELKEDNSGNAYRLEVGTHSDKDASREWDAKGWYAQTDKDFDNSSSGYTRGKGEAGAKGKIKLNDTFSVFGEAIQSEDRAVNASRSGETLGVTAKMTEKLTLDGFVRNINEDSTMKPTAVIGGNSAPLGGSLGATGGFYGLGVDQNGFASTGVASPGIGASQSLNATTIGVGVHYKATEKLNLEGLLEAGSENQKRLVLGSQYQVSERAKLFIRTETQTGLASAYSLDASDHSTSFAAGIDSTYMEGGSFVSEYRLRDAISNQQANLRDMQLANGLRNTWNISEGLTANTGVEYLHILKGASRHALALTGGADYTANPLWKLSGRLEYRRLFDDKLVAGDQAQDQWLSTLAVARKLDRDWTLLARNYLLYTANNQDAAGLAQGDAFQDRFQIGAAWRPVDNNKVNGLMRYEYKMARDKSQATGDDYDTHIVSTHLDYHPSRPWWMTGRLAAKYTTDYTLPNDQTYSAFLASGRVVYDITEKWDLGALGSVMYSPQGNSTQYAAGLEAGYQLQTNLWASLGFNFAGFYDRDLSGSDYTSQGVYLRLRFKFDENLFGGDKKEVNRTLSRD